MGNTFLLITILFIVAACFSEASVRGQTSDKEWTSVAIDDQLVYIDLLNTSSFKGDDIYVWVSENHNAPISIEPVKKGYI